MNFYDNLLRLTDFEQKTIRLYMKYLKRAIGEELEEYLRYFSVLLIK